MIVTYKEEGWQIITQRSHGLLAAQLAAHWRRKDRPARWTETLLAIAEHDDAENELDGENLLTPTGGPLNFDMKGFDLPHVQKLSSLTVTKSRYIALLTSMHMLFLYGQFEEGNPEAKRFLNGQKEMQKGWRKELGLSKEEADRCYDLVEWCDALSLLLCKGEAPPEKRSLEISKGPDQKMYYLVQPDEHSFTVEPWPFEEVSFDVCFETRTLPQLQFASSEEFRQAFLKASVTETVWPFRKTKIRAVDKKNKLASG